MMTWEDDITFSEDRKKGGRTGEMDRRTKRRIIILERGRQEKNNEKITEISPVEKNRMLREENKTT